MAEWRTMTTEQLAAYMRNVCHAQALIENRMTARQRKDEWLRVRYWEEYFAAGCKHVINGEIVE